MISCLVVIAILGAFLTYNTREVSLDGITKDSKYMVVGKKNVFVVYEDKLTLKIPFEVNINKETQVLDLVKKKKLF